MDCTEPEPAAPETADGVGMAGRFTAAITVVVTHTEPVQEDL